MLARQPGADGFHEARRKGRLGARYLHRANLRRRSQIPFLEARLDPAAQQRLTERLLDAAVEGTKRIDLQARVVLLGRIIVGRRDRAAIEVRRRLIAQNRLRRRASRSNQRRQSDQPSCHRKKPTPLAIIAAERRRAHWNWTLVIGLTRCSTSLIETRRPVRSRSRASRAS